MQDWKYIQDILSKPYVKYIYPIYTLILPKCIACNNRLFSVQFKVITIDGMSAIKICTTSPRNKNTNYNENFNLWNS